MRSPLLTIAISIVIACSGLHSATVSDSDHRMIINNAWWYQRGFDAYYRGDDSDNMPNRPGEIGIDSIVWKKKLYPVLSYASQDGGKSFSLKFELGTLTMKHYKGRMWEGVIMNDNGYEVANFKIGANDWKGAVNWSPPGGEMIGVYMYGLLNECIG